MSRTELLIGNRERDFLLVLDLIKKTSQTRCDLSFNESGNFLQSGSSTVKFLKTLQFQPGYSISKLFYEGKIFLQDQEQEGTKPAWL